MIGLGRMGASMALRLIRGGQECVVWDRNPPKVVALADEGGIASSTLEELVSVLSKPRSAWIMLPAGAPTEEMVTKLGELLDPGDVVIDGGNSFFKDDVQRAASLKRRGIDYVDVGTSGGVWGLERGYCLMIGGINEQVKRCEPIFKTLAPGKGTLPSTPGREEKEGTAEAGYLHCGPAGSGHFVKMVHNGIEYGIMQAYAEGFDLMRNAGNLDLGEADRLDLNLADIAELWRRGSVISSWLLDLTASALAEDPSLSAFTGAVQDSGEGRWTVQTAVEAAVPADVLSASLYARFRSRQQNTFGEKLLSAMRSKFGGHGEATRGR
jgi:6-phosphogluconate dehydrogenase